MVIDWKRWTCIGAGLVVTCVIIGVLAWPTTYVFVDLWSRSRTYAHGFLIIPATWYMIWEYRGRWMVHSPRPDPRGIALLVGLCAAWMVARLFGAQLLELTAVLLALPVLILAYCGERVLREVAWPLGLLIFALPGGAGLEPMLQQFTAEFIAVGLSLSTVPYERDGLLFHLSTRTWEVAMDCGGLRYLLPGLVLAYIFSGLVHRRALHRVHFLLISMVGFVMGNGVRATAIILGDHLGITEGTDHRVFSYSVFGALLLALWWIGLRWEERADATADRYHGSPLPVLATRTNNR